MKTVDPISAQLAQILATLPKDAPLVFVNLLRFHEQAQYQHAQDAQDAAKPCSGRDAYARYSAVALQKINKVGGKVMYVGRVAGLLIGPEQELWHEMALVRYPSLTAFTDMLAMPDYQAATRHRTAALDDARLIATVERQIV